MDHNEVRELLEDAAIEPDGLDRLMAGDTTAASIVAGHLAGCPDCADELERLRRSVAMIRPAVRAVPPPELRERTLAYVAAVGRPRGEAAAGRPATPAVATGLDAAEPEATPPAPVPLGPVAPAVQGGATPARSMPGDRERRTRLGWLAAMAAALIVAVGGTAILVNVTSETRARTLSAEIEALGDVTRWTLRVDSQSDARRLQLASASSPATSASLLYSPSSTELVIVADQLAPPPAGKEYRCWIEVGGTRSSIGRMFFGGNLAYWVGKVSEVSGVAPGTRFGVSLVDVNGAGPGDSVLVSD